jgi:undecaprenyl-diphosphatase
MSIGEAIVLAIVEGLTEFLPVSSTGHMIIASSVMGIAADPFTKTFTIAIQFGAILSVVFLYWRRFFQNLLFYARLLVAFIPAACIGFLLNDYIDQLLEHVTVVAWMLIAGGIVFLFIDRWFSQNEENPNEQISFPSAFKIGLFQCIALAPGVSRSAATIIGGMAQGLSKKTAAEFSFFLAVPTMFAATAYKLYKFWSSGAIVTDADWLAFGIGNVVAFVVAIIAIRSFIHFLMQHGFKIFGYYRIVVGVVILALHYLGVSLHVL